VQEAGAALGGPGTRIRSPRLNDEELQRKLAFVNLLEGRRAAIEQSQWQAPTLTIAAQAFLLAVLTDDAVPKSARWVILAAGVLACLSAMLALIRLRAREVLYSEAVSAACDTADLSDSAAV
jgi:hypothetical protein